MLHAHFQRTHAETFGLGQSLLIGPMLVCNAIARDGGAGAVRAASAVDENRPLGALVEKRKHSLYLRFGGGLEFAPRQAHIVHARALDGDHFGTLAAQVDHGSDADFGETGEAFAARLPAAVDMLVNLMEVGDAGNVGKRRGVERGGTER